MTDAHRPAGHATALRERIRSFLQRKSVSNVYVIAGIIIAALTLAYQITSDNIFRPRAQERFIGELISSHICVVTSELGANTQYPQENAYYAYNRMITAIGDALRYRSAELNYGLVSRVWEALPELQTSETPHKAPKADLITKDLLTGIAYRLGDWRGLILVGCL